MTEREALNLALEALTNAYWPTQADLIPAHNIKECAEAITAIKEALAQPEQEPVVFNTLASLKHKKTVGPIESAMSNTTQSQPETWEKFCDSNCVWTDHHPDCKLAQRKPLSDEEIKMMIPDGDEWKYGVGFSEAIAFARAIEAAIKPQRTWVGLTPQERDEINERVYGAVPHHVAFHAAIEARLKEKNT